MGKIDRAAVKIKFKDEKKPAETVSEMRSRLRRTDSTISQAIIAYRTLSITVSESQAKGIKPIKKVVAKDLVEGKKKIIKYIFKETYIIFLNHSLFQI